MTEIIEMINILLIAGFILLFVASIISFKVNKVKKKILDDKYVTNDELWFLGIKDFKEIEELKNFRNKYKGNQEIKKLRAKYKGDKDER